MFWMNAAERCVKCHLSDRDAHSACTLVAQSENSFAVAENDAFDAVVARVTQNLGDTIFVWIADEQAARLSPYLAETLATLAHSRRVHQRQHLFDIAN